MSGASGQLGKLVVNGLLAKGVPAKNLILVSRSTGSLDAVREAGRRRALRRLGEAGVARRRVSPAAHACFSSVSATAARRARSCTVAPSNAAKAAGVKQIAYTSWVALSKGDTTGLGVDHSATEELLKKSGVPYTFLRNSIYMDMLVEAGAKMVADGRATAVPNENRTRLRHPLGLRSRCRRRADHIRSRQQGLRHHGPRGHRASRNCSGGCGGHRQVHPGSAAGPECSAGSCSSVAPLRRSSVVTCRSSPAARPRSLRAFFEANKAALTGAKT